MVHHKYLFFISCLLQITIFCPVWADPGPDVDLKSAGHLDVSAGAAPAQTAAAGSTFDQAGIDWRRFNGETIKVLLSGHPIQGTILGLLADFKKLTGISVKTDVLPEEDFIQKLDIELEGGKGNIDVFMISPLFQWKYAKAGAIEDLTPYLEDPSLTDKTWYRPEDFFSTLWNASMWDGSIGGGLGRGKLFSIPAWWEGCMLMYRKDMAEKFQFTEPKDWDDLYSKVSPIPKVSGGKIYGFNGRGIRSWSQIHTYHMTMMASLGGGDLDPRTNTAAFNSTLGIAAGKYWIKMMRTAGSPNWPDYNWYEIASDFQAGKYFAIMDANPFAIIMEAGGSPVKGRVGYLLPPPGPKGRQSFLWTWGFGINSYSKRKDAGWLFIQWITSQSILRQAVTYGNWMAPRRSVWFDPDVKSMLSNIDDGRWYENSTLLVSKMAAMRWSPNPLAPMVGNIWAGAVQDAWRGTDTVEGALNRAADQVDAMMKKAGYSK